MTPQERDVITGIFERLKQVGDAPRDPEAERFIADQVASQPHAPYVMAQSLYVHEQAVANLQAQVEQLQARLREAQAEQNRPQQSGGFLSGLFGGAPSAPAPQRPSGMPPQSAGYAPSQQGAPQPGPFAQGASQQNTPSGPWGQQQAPAAGGFLRTAATTAAGVAGGMMLGNVLMNAFGGGGQAHAATPGAGALDTSTLGDALNGKGDQSAQSYDDGYQDAQQDADFDRQQAADDAYQDAQQDAAFDDGGGFDDGGDDWV